MELKRVVVTGLGAITPLGKTLTETWEGLVNGKSGAGPITHFDASKFKTQFACEVKNFDPNQYFDRKEARKLDRYAQFALIAADEAIADSGMEMEKLDLNKVGVIFSSGIGGISTFQEEVENYDGTWSAFQSFFHSENDCRHRVWSYFDEIRIQRT
jgi:3-oxoacyl-[acyl-carrier-protein] synthase II (EC 2.3.1.41)